MSRAQGAPPSLTAHSTLTTLVSIHRLPRPEPRPEMFSEHREVQLTRGATLTRDADKRLRRLADPSNVPGRAAAGMLALVRPGEEDLHATDVGGMSNASAIGVRGLCGRGACRVRRPPDPAQARGGRAGPWLVPASLSSRPQPGAWQIVAGRIRPHEKHITRTACAPGARCGASAARPTRRAAVLCF